MRVDDLPKDWDTFGVYNAEKIARLRAMTPAEKVQRIDELNRAAQKRAADRLRHENPTWTDKEIQAEVVKKWASGVEDYFV